MMFIYAFLNQFNKSIFVLLMKSSPLIKNTNSGMVFPYNETTKGKNKESGKFD